MEALAPIRCGIYVVFLDGKNTSATYRKSVAIRFAKRHPGSEVRGVSRRWWREGGMFGVDAPTFRICSQLVYSSPAK
jgi:hypothetical protein